MEDPVVYLRDVGGVAFDGEYDECWVVCAKGDPGSVAFGPLGPAVLAEEGYVNLRAKKLALGPGWKEGEAICIDTGLKGCTYVSTDLVA